MTITQETFPEIEAAAQALEKRIAIPETEMAQMKEDMAARKRLGRCWRKALCAVAPQSTIKRKKTDKTTKGVQA